MTRITLLLLLAVVACGGRDPIPLPAATDTLVAVGGHRLHFVVYHGTRPLTVVMEAGGGTDLETAWSGLEEKIASRTGATVVAYERAGFGRSELGPTGLTIDEQLHHLIGALEQLDVPTRRVVVGHSYGGLLALRHAAVSRDVAGLVLVDAMNPFFVDATGDFAASTVPEIPEPTSDRERAINRMKVTFDGLVSSARESAGSLSLPVAVVTAGEAWWGEPEIDQAWRQSHEALAERGERKLWVAEGAEHDIPSESPNVILEAVDYVLARIR